jgi:hypothetical protein
MRLLLRMVVLATIVVAVSTTPAWADPPEPGDIRSQVQRIEPAIAAVEAEIIGGDSLLRLAVAPGHEATVMGYEGEPYLWFRGDGTVDVNTRSPARYLNEDRFAAVAVPPGVDPAAVPDWSRVASDGSYEWHDHRTHWMAEATPDSPVRAWEVPLTVDGRDAVIHGEWRYESPPSAWPWLLGAAVIAGGVGWFGLRRSRLAAATAAVAGGLMGAVGVALWRLPGGGPGAATMALVAAGLALAAWVGARRTWTGPLLAGSGVALLIVGWQRLDVLDHSVLTTALPEVQERVAVALALGAGGAALVVGLVQTLGTNQPSGTRASASGGPHEPLG